MGMTYFVTDDGVVFAFDEEQIAEGYPFDPMRLMTPEEVDAHLNPPPDPLYVESEWRISELPVIARQLEALEEDEAGVPPEDLLPGTRKQWLAYRGKVSNWKEGAPGFPDQAQRPVRPA